MRSWSGAMSDMQSRADMFRGFTGSSTVQNADLLFSPDQSDRVTVGILLHSKIFRSIHSIQIPKMSSKLEPSEPTIVHSSGHVNGTTTPMIVNRGVSMGSAGSAGGTGTFGVKTGLAQMLKGG